ncbi:hypothetical protein CVT26_006563 [Gymnopilus dilepis]|uniref:Uncharacterized protein n=1 Tax=Gymnopilus dilepis TaxID=231916 RepID=A0A409Y300_9AGAR|nr:hypothetical protein CVT26_006563 [Gymnopilus dilepis]
MGQIISQFIDDIFFLFSRPVERLENNSPPTSDDDYSSGSEAETQAEDPPPAYEYPQPESPAPDANNTTRRTVTFFQNASNVQLHGCTFSNVQRSSYTRVVDQGQGGERRRQKSKHTGTTTGSTRDISPQAEEFFKSFQAGPKTSETLNEFYCHGAKITRMSSSEFHNFFTNARMNFDASGSSPDPAPTTDAQNSESSSSAAADDNKDRPESSSLPTQDVHKDHPGSTSPVQNANEGSSTPPREGHKESSNAVSEGDFDFEIVLAKNENKGEAREG